MKPHYKNDFDFFCSRQCMDVYDEKCETKYPAKCVEDQSCTMIYQTKCESSGYNQKCQQVPVQQCTPITKVNHFHENFRQIDFTEKKIITLYFFFIVSSNSQNSMSTIHERKMWQNSCSSSKKSHEKSMYALRS